MEELNDSCVVGGWKRLQHHTNRLDSVLCIPSFDSSFPFFLFLPNFRSSVGIPEPPCSGHEDLSGFGFPSAVGGKTLLILRMQNPNRKTLRGRPTCPTILVPFQQRLYALPLHRLDVEIEIHVSTAFVKITGEWRNIAKFKVCLLCCFGLSSIFSSPSVNSSILGHVIALTDHLGSIPHLHPSSPPSSHPDGLSPVPPDQGNCDGCEDRTRRSETRDAHRPEESSGVYGRAAETESR